MQFLYFTKGETEVHGPEGTYSGNFWIVSHFIFGSVPVLFSRIILDSYQLPESISLEYINCTLLAREYMLYITFCLREKKSSYLLFAYLYENNSNCTCLNLSIEMSER